MSGCTYCGTIENLQEHHISYEPEVKEVICVDCHQQRYHPNHGVGHGVGSKLFKSIEDKFIELHQTLSSRRALAKELKISYMTAFNWDKKLGMPKYEGVSSNNKIGYNFKENIREYFGRKCLKCGKTELENGQHLSVHCINYDINNNYNNIKPIFATFCKNCNTKINGERNREYWEQYFTKIIMEREA